MGRALCIRIRITRKHVCVEHKMSPVSCTEEKAQHRLLINLHKFNATRKKNAQLYNQAKVFARQKTIMQAQGSTESSLSQSIILILRLPNLKNSEEFLIHYSKSVWYVENPFGCFMVFLLVDQSPVKQFSFFFPLNLKDVQVIIIAKYSSNPYHN